jgi:hypothetical protein
MHPPGTPLQLEGESNRIKKRLAQLEAVAKAEAATVAASGDKGGAVLAGLKKLRQQRITALKEEIARLASRLEEERAAADGSKKGGAKAAPEAPAAPGGSDGKKDEL